MQALPSGTVTFLFTDIEGSTRLIEQHPDSMEEAQARHNALLKSAIDAHRGYVFQVVGDAFCSVFENPGDAASAALEAQRAIHGERSARCACGWACTPATRKRASLAARARRGTRAAGVHRRSALSRSRHAFASALSAAPSARRPRLAARGVPRDRARSRASACLGAGGVEPRAPVDRKGAWTPVPCG